MQTNQQMAWSSPIWVHRWSKARAREAALEWVRHVGLDAGERGRGAEVEPEGERAQGGLM